jgi:hypothetical protein
LRYRGTQVLAESLAGGGGNRRKRPDPPRGESSPSRIVQRLPDERCAARRSPLDRVGNSGPMRLEKVVQFVRQLIRHGRAQIVEMLKVNVKRPFRQFRFSRHVIDCDGIDRPDRKQRTRRPYQLGMALCAEPPPDLRPAHEVDPDHIRLPFLTARIFHIDFVVIMTK